MPPSWRPLWKLGPLGFRIFLGPVTSILMVASTQQLRQAQLYRSRAARCAELASKTNDENMKTRFLALATTYEKLAREADGNPDKDVGFKLATK
jgi:hypothetical protein